MVMVGLGAFALRTEELAEELSLSYLVQTTRSWGEPPAGAEAGVT